VSRCVAIEHAAHDQRLGLRVAFLARVELPGWRERGDVAAIDLRERRMAGPCVIAAINRPIDIRGGGDPGDSQQRCDDGGGEFHALRNLRQKRGGENPSGALNGAIVGLR
jgi:hypothetical protein